MKTSAIYPAIAFACFFILGCHGSMDERDFAATEQSPMAISATDSANVIHDMEESGHYDKKNDNGFISSSAAVVNKDTNRKFVRTADMQFRVKDVRRSTFEIEDVVSGFEGFVTYTHLSSTIDYKDVTAVSRDSSLETIYYTVVNNMTIRVPNTNLDTALKIIARQIDYLDHRTITAEDVTLSLLSNKLKQARLKTHESRLTTAIDERGKKLNETSNAEENLLNKGMLADQAKIDRMKTEDQIDFSTIHLNIYQRQTIRRDLVENDKNIEAYKPGFVHQVKEAVKSGWYALQLVILFLFTIWPLLVLIAAGWIAYRKFFRSKK